MSEFIEKGLVISSHNKKSEVKLITADGCKNKGCPLSHSCGKQDIIVEAENLINAKEGQIVKVGIQTAHFFYALFLIFVLPLILIISGYFLGMKLFKTENAGFIAIGVGLVIWIFILRFTSRFYKPRYRLIEILE